MQLRFLEYFVALAEERHFAGAARRCSVTQPTLSSGVSSLERLLGKRLVLRDRRFIDLTPEGEAVLGHARQIIAQAALLRQAIDAAGPLRGVLRLGVIPAAMPRLGGYLGALHMAHPELGIAIRQRTSAEILEGLAAYEVDAGLLYADVGLGPHLEQVPLYEERFQLAVPAASASDGPVTLADVVAQPLCLLHEGMMNRRIFDRHLAAQGLEARPVATADSYIALLSLVSGAGLAAVVTDSHARFASADAGIRFLPIADIAEPNVVTLVASGREPVSPIARAALAAAASLNMIDCVYQP